MNKTIIVVICVFVAAVIGIVFLWNPFSPELKSKILLAQMKVTKTQDGKIIMQIPFSTLPVNEDNKDLVSLTGLTVAIPNKAGNLIVIVKNGETVIPANIPYVHALEYSYIGKNVALKGSWRKDVVIDGKQYKSFWVENIDLMK